MLTLVWTCFAVELSATKLIFPPLAFLRHLVAGGHPLLPGWAAGAAEASRLRDLPRIDVRHYRIPWLSFYSVLSGRLASVGVRPAAAFSLGVCRRRLVLVCRSRFPFLAAFSLFLMFSSPSNSKFFIGFTLLTISSWKKLRFPAILLELMIVIFI